MELIDIHTKAEAVAYVSAVMQSNLALLSPNFRTAMDASQAYDISAQDVLIYRKERAKNALDVARVVAIPSRAARLRRDKGT